MDRLSYLCGSCHHIRIHLNDVGEFTAATFSYSTKTHEHIIDLAATADTPAKAITSLVAKMAARYTLTPSRRDGVPTTPPRHPPGIPALRTPSGNHRRSPTPSPREA